VVLVVAAAVVVVVVLSNLKQSVKQQFRVLRDSSSEHVWIDRDRHLYHSQQADGDVKARRADLELTTVQLTAKSTRTHYHLLQLHRQI